MCNPFVTGIVKKRFNEDDYNSGNSDSECNLDSKLMYGEGRLNTVFKVT